MDITLIECRTRGLYEDGRGMTGKAAGIWQDFWSHYGDSHIFWHVSVTDSAIYLSTVYGGGMIHPEGFRICVAEPEERLHNELDELRHALDELAEKIGFGYSLGTMRARGVDFGELINWSSRE